MNVRTLLIIAGLALPVVAFAILTQSTPQSPKTTAVRTDISTDNEITSSEATRDTPADATTPATAVAQPEAPAQQQQQAADPTAATVGPDAGLVPKDVTPGPMTVPPVLLPEIAEEAPPAAEAPAAHMPAPKAAAPANPQVDPLSETLEQAIARVKERLAYLEKMDPADWPEERKNHAGAPESLYKAKEYNRNRLAKLATMSKLQWEQEQKKAKAKLLAPLQNLAPEDRQAAPPKPQLPPLEPSGAAR